MSIGSGSKEANDRNAEQNMTFVDDTKEFRDCSMSVLHDSICMGEMNLVLLR